METISNLNSLSAFVQVAQHSSFSAAAKKMHVSKAYLSKMIQSLELELGQKLFHRTTRIVKLTKEGEVFFDHCHEALQKIQQAKKNLTQTEQIPRGNLKITLAGVFGEEYITPLALNLMKIYPELSVELSFSEKIVNLEAEDFDLAIRVGTLNDSQIKAVKIAVRKEYICATKSYLDQFGIPKKPEELRAHQCILGNNDQWSFQDKKKQKSIKVTGKIRSNNGRVMLNAVRQGLGIAKLPGVYVKDLIDKGELIPLLQDYLPHEIPIWAIIPTHKKEALRTQVFLKELEKLAKEYY